MSKECLNGDTMSDIDIGSDDYCKNDDEGQKETIHDENAKSYQTFHEAVPVGTSDIYIL